MKSYRFRYTLPNMFGNLQGWIIAGIVFVAILLGVWQATGINEVTAPTKFSRDAKMISPLALEVSPTTIVPMDTPGDATADYRRAIADIRQNAAKYDSAIKSADAPGAKLKTLSDLPAVKAALAAAPMNAGTPLGSNLDENVGYTSFEAKDLAALVTLGKCLETAGLFAQEKDPKQGRKYFEAQFSMGAKMFNERISYWEAFNGLGQMRTAADGLKMIAKKEKDDAEIQKLEAFSAAGGDLIKERLEPMWKVISSVKKETINTHAGDIFVFTDPAVQKEKMWRIESILKLGRHKFNVGRKADQTIVPFRLADLKNDPDPAVKVAVAKADALTSFEHHMSAK